jgi:TPR repeat protein
VTSPGANECAGGPLDSPRTLRYANVMRGRRVRVVTLLGLLAVAGRANAQLSSSGGAPAAAKKPATSVSGTFDRLPSRPEARFALAQRYEVGNGTLKDAYLAAHWARLAAEASSLPAVEWLKAGAEGGNPFAQLQLGMLLKKGAGKKPDPKAAEVWIVKAMPALRAAATAKEPQAAMALGVVYANGLGVAADDKEAYAWFWSASKQFYPPAMGAWAMALLNGKGIPANPASFEWALRDGMQLRLSRGWPDTTPVLEYVHPAHLTKLKQEQASEDARRTVEKSQAQSNAF